LGSKISYRFLRVLLIFGIFREPGDNVPGEAGGKVRPVFKWRQYLKKNQDLQGINGLLKKPVN
jgi:hypothetical protein